MNERTFVCIGTIVINLEQVAYIDFAEPRFIGEHTHYDVLVYFAATTNEFTMSIRFRDDEAETARVVLGQALESRLTRIQPNVRPWQIKAQKENP